MLPNKIKIKRYIGHHDCQGYLFIKGEDLIFEPDDFTWESLRFTLSIKELSSLSTYDIFTIESHSKEKLINKALSIKTITGSQYILGCDDIEKLINRIRLLTLKQDRAKLIYN